VEVTGGWRKLHEEELHNLFSAPNIIRVIKTTRMNLEAYGSVRGEDEKCI